MSGRPLWAPSWTSVGDCEPQFEKYEAAFRENEINERVLPSLTAEDLKELGVTALGHRWILPNAIAALSNDTKVPTPAVAAAPARPSIRMPTATPLPPYR